jgi:hypothetical protein
MPATHAVDAVGLVLPTSLCAGQVRGRPHANHAGMRRAG